MSTARILVPILLVSALIPSSRAAAAFSELDSLLRSYPAESLVAPLRRFETEHGRVREGGEAALMLGRFHYARGEYRQAAEALARAAARLDPSRKQEARYWLGLCYLATKDPDQARAALEDVSQSDSPRRTEASLAIALAWEQARKPERAYEELGRLLAGDPGEAGPAALERRIVLAEQLHFPMEAQDARARLLKDYPNSIEAAGMATVLIEPPGNTAAGTISVQIGVFSSFARARSLTNAARHAGFTTAEVVTIGEGRGRTFSVRIGTYPNVHQARQAGESASKKLGTAYRLVGAR